MWRTFALGDCHGRHKALKQVLSDSKFDYDNDRLIILGDIVDGGFNTALVIDELIKIKNKVFIFGNHDLWHMDFLFKGTTPSEWINQGGANTLNSYGGKVIPNNKLAGKPIMLNVHGVKVPKKHVEFLASGVYYHEEQNMLFVHGGIDPTKEMINQDKHFLIWDRSLIKYAETSNVKDYDKVFIGHTSTQHIERGYVNYKCRHCKHEWEKEVKNQRDMTSNVICEKCSSNNVFQSLGCTHPIKIGNLYCLDCGAGWNGKLALMDINTDEFWLSELQEPAIVR